jgi:hypothetical protein
VSDNTHDWFWREAEDASSSCCGRWPFRAGLRFNQCVRVEVATRKATERSHLINRLVLEPHSAEKALFRLACYPSL